MSQIGQLLQEKYDFSEDVAQSVGELAQQQLRDYGSYQELLTITGADQLTTVNYDGFKSAEVVDIRPKDHETTHALIVHVAMANTLDANQLVQISTIATANPDYRVIAMGNPGAPGYSKSRLLTRKQRKQVAHGDFSPATDPLLKYLDESGIETVDHYGYSYGEVTTTDAVTRASQETQHALVLDPATTAEWISKFKIIGAAKLGLAFNATAPPLNGYARESNWQPYLDARNDSPGAITYTVGLGRLTNLATAFGLAHGGFTTRTHEALLAQPDMLYTAAHGIKSEFNVDESTDNAVKDLIEAHGERVVDRPVDGHHAVANNIYFQAALVKEALARKKI